MMGNCCSYAVYLFLLFAYQSKELVNDVCRQQLFPFHPYTVGHVPRVKYFYISCYSSAHSRKTKIYILTVPKSSLLMSCHHLFPQVTSMFQQVVSKFSKVHVVVNNAGMSANHSLLEGTPEEWRTMLDVNIVGVCLLTKLAVENMRQNAIDDGHIVNVSRWDLEALLLLIRSVKLFEKYIYMKFSNI